jgi:hypothetical protein
VNTRALGAQEAIDLFCSHGATFTWGGEPLTKANPLAQPGGVVSEDGSIIVPLDIYHSLLAVGKRAPDGSGAAGQVAGPGKGFLGFSACAQGVSVSQFADLVDSPQPDALATGLLALATRLYSPLRPEYGWVDESGWNVPEGRTLAAPHPRYLFWANFFGPERVELMGREFLKGAPGWVSIDLADGGVLHIATESYRDWWGNDQPELLGYFKRKFPKIQIYRAQPVPY